MSDDQGVVGSGQVGAAIVGATDGAVNVYEFTLPITQVVEFTLPITQVVARSLSLGWLEG